MLIVHTVTEVTAVPIATAARLKVPTGVPPPPTAIWAPPSWSPLLLMLLVLLLVLL